MINNEPKWQDVEAVGEVSKVKYFGRFYLKPYLTHGEKNDVARLAALYNRGIEDQDKIVFNTNLAYLKFHIVKADATWWSDQFGMDMYEEAPVYEIIQVIKKMQNPEQASDTKADPKPE